MIINLNLTNKEAELLYHKVILKEIELTWYDWANTNNELKELYDTRKVLIELKRELERQLNLNPTESKYDDFGSTLDIKTRK